MRPDKHPKQHPSSEGMAFFFLMFLMAASTQAGAAPAWRADYRTASEDTLSWATTQCGAGGTHGSCSRLTIVTPPVDVRTGNAPGGRALKVVVVNNDNHSDGERNELLGSKETENLAGGIRNNPINGMSYYGEGAERFFSWSSYFPAEAQFPAPAQQGASSNSNAWYVFTQLHQESNCGPPPFELALSAMGGTDYQITFSRRTFNAQGVLLEYMPWSIPINRGRWHRFVLRVKFSSSASIGSFQLWHDGQEVVASTAAATLFDWPTTRCPYDPVTVPVSGSQSAYLKQGLYRKGGSDGPTAEATAYHKGMRVGPTYSSVAEPSLLMMSTPSF